VNSHDHLMLKRQAALFAKCDAYARLWHKQSQLVSKRSAGVGVVKIFCYSDSSGWKSFRLRLHDSDSTALVWTCAFRRDQQSWTNRFHSM